MDAGNESGNENGETATSAGTETVLVPGRRDARGVLDVADRYSESDEPGAVVVACPPHPQYGGSRSDSRLTAVSTALRELKIDCLRFDYGDWDEGRGERTDTRNALRWATERYDRVGLFGYSFGATMALLAAGEATVEDAPETPNAVSVLAPHRGDFGVEGDADDHADPDIGRDAVAALDRIAAPLQVVYGERDTTVAWEPIVSRARERDFAFEGLPADHFFVGQSENVATLVASFLAPVLR